MLAKNQFKKSALSLSLPYWRHIKPYQQLCCVTLMTLCGYSYAQTELPVQPPFAQTALTEDLLDTLPIQGVDEAMVNQIYQIAEQAKADVQHALAEPSADLVVNDATQQELEEINAAPVSVEQLTQSIRADREIVVKANATGEYLPTQPSRELKPRVEQPGLFKRLVNRVRPPRNLMPQQVERITAVVQLQASAVPDGVHVQDYETALQNLENNLTAKLSTFTAEEFLQFETAVPQLRALSIQAAQAVGFYDASFSFEPVANDKTKVLVRVIPNTPVLVTKQNTEISGEGSRLSQFKVIAMFPEFDPGEIFHHGIYESIKETIDTTASNSGFFDAYWRLHDVKVALPQNRADIHLRYETGSRYKLAQPIFRMSQPNQAFPLDPDVLQKMVPWQGQEADYTQWRVNTFANNLTNSRYFNFSLVEAIIPDPLEVEKELPPDIEQLLQENQLSSNVLGTEKKAPTNTAIQSQTVADESQFAGLNEENADIQALDRTRIVQESQQSELEQLKEKARNEKIVPVIVTLNADDLNSLEVGVGYGTDTGARLRGQYRRAIVNKRGYSFDANVELSEIRQSIDGRYNIPYQHPLYDYISLVGGYEREERNNVSDTGGLTIESGVAGADRIIKDPQKNWQHVFGLRYRLDRLTETGVQDESIEKPEQFINSGEQESLLVGYEVSYSNSQPPLNPISGFKQLYKVELGTQSLLSDTDMAIVNAVWSGLYSMGRNDNHQFVGRAHLGYIFTDSFKDVPYNLRYFAGGDQTLRGFDYKSLSPEENGYKLGGQAMALGSLEYNYQFKPSWRAAVFTDFGNAYNENFSNDTEYSVGLGIRWASPIGPLRLDVASGLSDDNHPIRVHFFIGSQL